MYQCPLCGSGTGKSKTGAFGLYEENGVQKWKCQSCGKVGDIFDLIGAREHMTDFAEQLNRAAEIFGLDIDGDYQTRPQAAAKAEDFTAFTARRTATSTRRTIGSAAASLVRRSSASTWDIARHGATPKRQRIRRHLRGS